MTKKLKGGMPRGPRPIKTCHVCGAQYKGSACRKCLSDQKLKWHEEARQSKDQVREGLKWAWELTQRIGESMAGDILIKTELREALRVMDYHLRHVGSHHLYQGESASADLGGSEQAAIDAAARALLDDLDI